MVTKRMWMKTGETDPKLAKLLKEALEKVKNMTAEELREMTDAQRESWTRQDID